MPFPFTFIFNVPGLINPFATANSNNISSADIGSSKPRLAAQAAEQYYAPPFQPQHSVPGGNRPKINRPRPPSPDPTSVPISRKRSWQPTFAEPSRSTTTLASTSGYLDVPAPRSGDSRMGSSWSTQYLATTTPVDHDDPHVQEDMPPLKKRRGLAGTIISTALNAALIGGAVGFTVYRLWKNRGNLQQQQDPIETAPVSAHDDVDEQTLLPPPPPYEASSASKPISSSLVPNSKRSEQVFPAAPPTTPRGSKKVRHSHLTRQAKRPVVYARCKRGGHHHHHHSSSSSSDPITRPEFDIEPMMQQDDSVVNKMDWIGDKLSMLIEQGKKALSSQVVVMSDAKEDEVDDGSAAWEEEEEAAEKSSSSPRRSGSVRHAAKRPRALNIGPAAASSSSPPFAFGPGGSAPSTAHSMYGFSGWPDQQSRGTSFPTSHSMTSLHNVNTEDPTSFESPELRESMERARERLMARRGMGGT